MMSMSDQGRDRVFHDSTFKQVVLQERSRPAQTLQPFFADTYAFQRVSNRRFILVDSSFYGVLSYPFPMVASHNDQRVLRHTLQYLPQTEVPACDGPLIHRFAERTAVILRKHP